MILVSIANGKERDRGNTEIINKVGATTTKCKVHYYGFDGFVWETGFFHKQAHVYF